MGLLSCLCVSAHSSAFARNTLLFSPISSPRFWLSLHFLWDSPGQQALIPWPAPGLTVETGGGQELSPRLHPCVPSAVLGTEGFSGIGEWPEGFLERESSHLFLLSYSTLARIKQLPTTHLFSSATRDEQMQRYYFMCPGEHSWVWGVCYALSLLFWFILGSFLGSRDLIRYTICKCFLSFCELPFHFVDYVLWCTKVLNFGAV